MEKKNVKKMMGFKEETKEDIEIRYIKLRDKYKDSEFFSLLEDIQLAVFNLFEYLEEGLAEIIDKKCEKND